MKHLSTHASKPRAAGLPRKRVVAMAITALLCGSAFAFEIEGDSDVKVRWDTSIKYTGAWRLGGADLWVANQNGAQPNTDFGDLSFSSGQQINDRFDLSSSLDVSYKNFGLRVSGSAWNDSVYAKGSGNYPSGAGRPPNYQAAFPGSLAGGANNVYGPSAKNTMGQMSELQDAFVRGKFDLGEQSVSVRLGNHSLIYGESLFLGANGIAAAQGPADLVKALSLPNALFKDIAIPVNQLSATWALGDGLALEAYTQFEWKPLRVPAAGSYFSGGDFVGEGGNLMLHPFGCVPALPGNNAACGAPGYPFNNSTGLATRGQDFNGSDSGQFGLHLAFKAGDVDYGLYAARYDSKAPIPVLNVASIVQGKGAWVAACTT